MPVSRGRRGSGDGSGQGGTAGEPVAGPAGGLDAAPLTGADGPPTLEGEGTANPAADPAPGGRATGAARVPKPGGAAARASQRTGLEAGGGTTGAGGADGGSGADAGGNDPRERSRRRGKRKSKPTSKARGERQATKERYVKAREDAQLAGVVETSPEGAIRNERVLASQQSEGCAVLPEMVREALADNWAVPDSAKRAVVAALLEPFYRDDVVLDVEGKQVRVKPSRRLLMELAKVLRTLDQTQWERDHPEEVGKMRGGGGAVAVSVQANIDAVALLNRMVGSGELGALGESGRLARGDSEPEAAQQ